MRQLALTKMTYDLSPVLCIHDCDWDRNLSFGNRRATIMHRASLLLKKLPKGGRLVNVLSYFKDLLRRRRASVEYGLFSPEGTKYLGDIALYKCNRSFQLGADL